MGLRMKKPFCAVIGAGQVGATAAQRIVEKGIAHAVLFDIVEGLAEGKALDLMQAAPLEGHAREVRGTTRYGDIEGADVVVIACGLPRKPGMSREDLLSANAGIIRGVSENIKRFTPDAVLIVVTNPLDIMTSYVQKVTGFSHGRVMGMAGVLDSARMRYFIAEKLGLIPKDVSAMVLGGHGDLMGPVMGQARVDGKGIDTIPRGEIEAIVRRTRDGGAEIVKLLKTGSAFYAPASSVAMMVQAIIKDEKRVLPVSAYCRGEYGIDSGYCGVPVRLGRQGILEIVEVPLSDQERQALQRSAQKVREGVQELEALVK